MNENEIDFELLKYGLTGEYDEIILKREYEKLQQAKDSLQKDYQEAIDKIDELKAEIEELTTDNEWWHNRYNAEHKIAFEDFKPKIDKTIEYIKKGKKLSNNKDYDYLVNAEKILEILGDKENE